MHVFANCLSITDRFIVEPILKSIIETDIKLQHTKTDNSFIKKVFFGPYKLFTIGLNHLHDPIFLQNYPKIFKIATRIIGIALLTLPLIASFALAFPLRQLLDTPNNCMVFPPPMKRREIPSFLSIVDADSSAIQNYLISNIAHEPVRSNFDQYDVSEDMIVHIGNFLNARSKLAAMLVSKQFLKCFRHADLWSSYLEHPDLRIWGAINKWSFCFGINRNVAEASDPYDQLKAFHHIKKTLCDEFVSIARLMPGGPLAFLKIPEISTFSELSLNNNDSVMRVEDKFLALRIKDYQQENSDTTLLIFKRVIFPTSIIMRDRYIQLGNAPEEVDEFLREQANYHYGWVQEKNQYFEINIIEYENLETSVLALMRGQKFENSFSSDNNTKDIRLV